jgi:hypothetical protein
LSVFFVTANLLLIMNASAQMPTRLVFNPLPPFTQQSPQTVGTSAKAFYDSSNNQVVIVLPGPNAGNTISTLRYDLGNRVLPKINYSVTTAANGGISYKYTVSDGTGSGATFARFRFLAPSHDSTYSANQPVGANSWQFSTADTSLADHTSTVNMGGMRLLSWQSPNGLALPGSGSISVGLTSSYLPGFCDAYVDGAVATPLTDEVAASLPASVASDLQRVLEPSVSSVRMSVFCPLFKPGASASVIASNFYLGIQHLIQNRALDGGTQYIQGLTAYLKNFLASGGAGNLAPPADEAVTDNDKQISTALAISLHQ